MRAAILVRCGAPTSALALGGIGVVAIMNKKLFTMAAALIAVAFLGYASLGGFDSAGEPTIPTTPDTAQAAGSAQTSSEETPAAPQRAALEESAPPPVTAPAGLGSLRVIVHRERDGLPVEGIGVSCQPWTLIPHPAQQLPFPRTDAKGVVVFADLAPGPYVVALDRALGATAQVEAGIESTVSVNLATGLNVHGTVRDAAGTPVAGARVMLLGNRRSSAELAVTDTAGHYRCEDISEGHSLLVRASGYAPSLCHALRGRPGSEIELDLVLPSTARRVIGQVLDSDGTPVAGAAVAFLPVSVLGRSPLAMREPHVRAPFLTTDVEGRFATHEVTTEAQVAVACSADRPRDTFARAELVEGRGEAFVTLHLRRGATVQGQTRDGAEPMGQATVIAWAEKPDDDIGYLLNSFGLKQQITGPDGGFELTGLAPGEYHLKALRGPVFAQHRLTLREGESFAWNPTRRLETAWPVRVEPADPGTGPRGLPHWGVFVYRRHAEGGHTLAGSASTEPDGTARVTGLEPGRYDVVLQAQLDWRARSQVLVAHYTDIDVSTEEVVFEVPQEDLPASRLNGRVLDATGRPTGNVRVVAVRSSTIMACSAETMSDAEGRFSIGPLTRGKYSLRLAPAGANPVFIGQRELFAGRDENVGDVRLR